MSKQSQIVAKYGPPGQVQVWETEHLELEANLAASLIERWGMVCAEPDGEDSAGRQKLRLQTPDELVQRAFDVAHDFMDQARIRGLIHTTPDLPPSKEWEGEPKVVVDTATKPTTDS